MAWTLGSVTIRPGEEGFTGRREAFYAIQPVLDANEETVSRFGAGSARRTLRFTLFEDDNGGSGLATLEAAVQGGNISLAGDLGSEGTYRILSFNWSRVQDFANTLPVYNCSVELIKV